MNEALKKLLENEVHNYCFSWETEAPKDGKKRSWTVTMTPDDEKKKELNTPNGCIGKNAKDDKPKTLLDYEDSFDPDPEEDNDYEPEGDEEVVRVLVRDNNFATAILLHDKTTLNSVSRLHALLVAYCREAAELMRLDFNDLLGKLEEEMVDYITTATMCDILDKILAGVTGKDDVK